MRRGVRQACDTRDARRGATGLPRRTGSMGKMPPMTTGRSAGKCRCVVIVAKLSHKRLIHLTIFCVDDTPPGTSVAHKVLPGVSATSNNKRAKNGEDHSAVLVVGNRGRPFRWHAGWGRALARAEFVASGRHDGSGGCALLGRCCSAPCSPAALLDPTS